MSNTRSWITAGGTTSSAVTAGGQPDTVNTETLNGSTWAEANNLSTARSYTEGEIGTGASALQATGTGTAATEEWTNPIYTIKTVTVS